MNTSNKTTNKLSDDPFDKVIFEKGLRIASLVIDKKLDLMLVLLNNRKVLRLNISDFPTLKRAKLSQLLNYELIGRGVGISWTQLDEDLSLKGFIKSAALNAALHTLNGNDTHSFA